jgi:hypothetical protein
MTIVKMDTVKWSKKLKSSTGDRNLLLIVLDIINEVYSGPQSLFTKQIQSGRFRPLNNRYRLRTQKQGYNAKPWVRSGSFLTKMSTPMTQLTQDGKRIVWKSSIKKATLEIHNAIGKKKGEKSKDQKTKRAIFWGNQLRRPFYALFPDQIAKAQKAAAKRLGLIFKEQGLK